MHATTSPCPASIKDDPCKAAALFDEGRRRHFSFFRKPSHVSKGLNTWAAPARSLGDDGRRDAGFQAAAACRPLAVRRKQRRPASTNSQSVTQAGLIGSWSAHAPPAFLKNPEGRLPLKPRSGTGGHTARRASSVFCSKATQVNAS